jgi:transposase InsO family protein
VLQLLWQRTGSVLGRGLATAGSILRTVLAPAPGGATGVAGGLLLDLTRSKLELLTENAFLRQQLVVAARHMRKPRFRSSERALLVMLAALLSTWRDVLVLVKPETLLRWHRALFRWLWRQKSKPSSPRGRRLTREVITLIRRMACESRLWGAERIRGELLKLGISVAKSTIQRYLSRFRSVPPDGQRWSTFLRNQAPWIWCCDLFEVRDLWFSCHFVFVVMHLESRRILRVVTSRAPSSEWLSQQLRELTPFGKGPKFLLRDNDARFGATFDDVAKGAGIRIIRTPILAPKANGHVERLIGSIRRECLDHVLVHNEQHLQRILDKFRSYFNDARPHQGLGQMRPTTVGQPARTPSSSRQSDRVISRPILGGLHHDYRRAA